MSQRSVDLVNILPEIHALTGCNTSKKQAYKAALKPEDQVALKEFGKKRLDRYIVISHKKYLLDSSTRRTSRPVEIFDEFSYYIFHSSKNFDLDLNTFLCTSSSLVYHIRRAYLQANLWLHPGKLGNIPELDPIQYGYQQDDDGHLLPVIRDKVLRSDFLMPCTCIKCGKRLFSCRVQGIG